MRIQLDYYRILGLPIQATMEQLQQAYRDRALQLPRREYSELAIAARKQLLDEAYTILSDPKQRLIYDATFLANTLSRGKETGLQFNADLLESNGNNVNGLDLDIDPFAPSLEIKNEQFVGALLILHELGEYELLIKLARPYLSSANTNNNINREQLGDPYLVRFDIVLTVALACLELGREQWQQGQYENAALSLETGQQLLLHEELFTNVQAEIQADLYKLRPYRILELLALPEQNLVERRQGLKLLEEVLQDRGGIDGNGDDKSGLSIDDFLRFIQQLRTYLTASEQQTLFETEARRPSAVATYLAVYAFLARGFRERHPSLIRQAKLMLIRLGKRQDVHLEQAVCALLLGQTEEASTALELSQEAEIITFIRENSEGAPDLLPGLCLYSERWLQKEVFPHFRDLVDQKVSLKEYFANPQVEAYLENLPKEIESAQESSMLENSQSVGFSSKSSSLRMVSTPAGVSSRSISSRGVSPLAAENSAPASQSSDYPSFTDLQARSPQENSSNSEITSTSEHLSASKKGERQKSTSKTQIQTPFPSSLRSSETNTKVSSSQTKNEEQPRLPPSRRKSKSKFSGKNQRLILLGMGAIISFGILGFLAYGWTQKTSKSVAVTPTPIKSPVASAPEPSPSPISSPETTISTSEKITKETAQEVVQTWLSTKADALGSKHNIDKLDQVLTDPVLSVWKKRALTAKEGNGYWEYKHSVEVTSVQANNQKPEVAKVEAVIKEVADFYDQGKLNKSSSYNENLRVRYDLISKNNQWLIRDMTILK